MASLLHTPLALPIPEVVAKADGPYQLHGLERAVSVLKALSESDVPLSLSFVETVISGQIFSWCFLYSAMRVGSFLKSRAKQKRRLISRSLAQQFGVSQSEQADSPEREVEYIGLADQRHIKATRILLWSEMNPIAAGKMAPPMIDATNKDDPSFVYRPSSLTLRAKMVGNMIE